MANIDKRRRYRGVMLVSVVAIGAAAVTLLYLGVYAVMRQRQAIDGLTTTNQRLSGERLVTELERQTADLAEAVLSSEEFRRFVEAATRAEDPAGVRAARDILSKLRGEHPIARHFFVIENNRVRFPPSRTFPRRSLRQLLSALPPERAGKIARLFDDAERLELRQKRPDLALGRYRQSYESDDSPSIEALALARMARCLSKLGRSTDVEKVYRKLGEDYADVYDPSHRPYGLVASLELGELEHVVDDLVRGRWELTQDQIEFFLDALGGLPRERADDSDYLKGLMLGGLLHRSFQHPGPITSNQTYRFAIANGASSYQLFYRALAPSGKPDTVAGFAVDLDWVRASLLSGTSRRIGLSETLAVSLVKSDVELGASQRVSFSTLFPFWALEVRPLDATQGVMAARRELSLFAAAVVLVLGVLALGIFLLMRDASREMQLARMRSDFVSGVSHELKTPLTLIRLYGETLMQGDALPPAKRSSFSRVIVQESDRLTHLIERVLDFARVGRGRKRYRLVEGDLAPVVSRTVDAYRDYLSRRGFSIATDLSEDLPPVRFDADAVSQAVVNLVDNAVKYSGDSRYVGIRLFRRGGDVIFEVEDHGVGIAPSERERIFEQFYRSEKSTGRGGYGLGLFLTKHIMEAHGGRIELETETGRGSILRLVFPKASSSRGDEP